MIMEFSCNLSILVKAIGWWTMNLKHVDTLVGIIYVRGHDADYNNFGDFEFAQGVDEKYIEFFRMLGDENQNVDVMSEELTKDWIIEDDFKGWWQPIRIPSISDGKIVYTNL